MVIPIPPLAEQTRIVNILDEALNGLATAKTNAEKKLQNARCSAAKSFARSWSSLNGAYALSHCGR